MRGINAVIGFVFLGIASALLGSYVNAVIRDEHDACRMRECPFSTSPDIGSYLISLGLATAVLIAIMVVANLVLAVAARRNRR